MLYAVNHNHSFATRSILAIFAFVAIVWGLDAFPIFWRASPIEHIAGRIIAGDPFRPEILAQQTGVMDSIRISDYCQPGAIRSVAIIELRILEAARASGSRDSERLSSLRDIIRHSLMCAPADPFLWLVLYQLESIASGSSLKYLNYLRISYQLGPNEGWIGLKRDPITFALPDPIPADLFEDATREFVGLVKMGSYQEATDIIAGPAKRFSQPLLESLANISEDNRRSFATILYPKLDDVVVPGVERDGPHH